MLLSFATEDFGDDAFHLTAIPAVNQSRAPISKRITAGDQAGKLSETTLHKFSLCDRCAVGDAELGPGDHAGHHDSHRAGSICAERYATEIETMIGDREPVTFSGDQ